MTKEDIKRCIGEFASAAVRVNRIGYGVIELHGAEAPYAPKMMACHPKLRPQLFPKRAQPAG